MTVQSPSAEEIERDRFLHSAPLRELQRQLESAPEESERWYYLRARVANSFTRYDEALVYAERACTIDPTSPHASALASWLRALKDTKDPADDLRDCVHRFPELIYPRFLLGSLLAARGQLQDAVAILEASPDLDAWLIQLGLAEMLIRTDDLESARHHLRAFVRNHPKPLGQAYILWAARLAGLLGESESLERMYVQAAQGSVFPRLPGGSLMLASKRAFRTYLVLGLIAGSFYGLGVWVAWPWALGAVVIELYASAVEWQWKRRPRIWVISLALLITGALVMLANGSFG